MTSRALFAAHAKRVQGKKKRFSLSEVEKSNQPQNERRRLLFGYGEKRAPRIRKSFVTRFGPARDVLKRTV
jgi:hypothetical protein